MSNKISWTDQTWNPVTGCTKISAGCRNCYAERMSRRLAGRCGYPPAPENFKVTLRPERLEQPLRWRKPRMVFVCSMGDLFHDSVPPDFVDSVFSRMEVANWHTYQILTKRPENMLKYIRAAYLFNDLGKHIWLGITAENQKAADERRAAFEQVHAAVKFVSYEPALGLVDWSGWEFINLLIAGGETGPGARPSHPDWFRSARDWSQAAGVPFHFKQHGQFIHTSQMLPGVHYSEHELAPTGDHYVRCRGGSAGHLLDGREWRQMPEVKK